MIEIPIVNYSQFRLIIDDEDFELVRRHRWCLEPRNNWNTYYARAWIKGQSKVMYAHRLILPSNPELVIHHIDRNGLNCQKKNLVRITRAENSWLQFLE